MTIDLAAIRARNEAEEWGDPQQINTDVADLLYHVETLTDGLEAVRELHREGRNSCCAGGTICDHCEKRWPCPTIRALDGDDS